MGDRRRRGSGAADAPREVPGARGRRQHRRGRARGRLPRDPSLRLHRPAGRKCRHDGRSQPRDCEVRAHRREAVDLRAAKASRPRQARGRSEAAHARRRSRGRSGGRRVARSAPSRRALAGSARGPARHDPALSDVLGGDLQTHFWSWRAGSPRHDSPHRKTFPDRLSPDRSLRGHVWAL